MNVHLAIRKQIVVSWNAHSLEISSSTEQKFLLASIRLDDRMAAPSCSPFSYSALVIKGRDEHSDLC
jgi:hypothetical protein